MVFVNYVVLMERLYFKSFIKTHFDVENIKLWLMTNPKCGVKPLET